MKHRRFNKNRKIAVKKVIHRFKKLTVSRKVVVTKGMKHRRFNKNRKIVVTKGMKSHRRFNKNRKIVVMKSHKRFKNLITIKKVRSIIHGQITVITNLSEWEK